LVGSGDTNLNGEIIDLAWEREAGLVAIINENFNGHRQRLWQSRIDGAFAVEGSLITEALDSGIEGCQWHRALLDASVPEGASLLIESFTSENLVDQQLVDIEQAPWKTCVLSGDDNPDCLIQSGPGRYLWLRLTFRSDGLASPALRRMKVFFPRQSYLQYLPAVFQEDEESRLFLERFLSIFQTEFDRFDERIDRIWQLFDPASVPERHFDWLAGWLALVLQPEWSLEKKRQMLKGAFKSYLLRGTAAGIERAIQDYAGVQFAKIVEHYKLRRWPALYSEPEQSGPRSQPALSDSARLSGGLRLWSRNFYHRLQITSHSQIGDFLLTGRPEPVIEALAWGAHQFTVFFPANPYRVEETERRIERVVEREKPAHTDATLCPVLPRMRVGVQASIGVDSVVGGVSHLVLNHLSTLNYDTILACSAEERGLRALNAVVRPRAGLSARLL
jgi:phage tail-like protein